MANVKQVNVIGTTSTAGTANTQIDNLNKSDHTETDKGASNQSVNQADMQSDTQKPHDDKAEEQTDKTDVRHTVTYIGYGVWYDKDGREWTHNQSDVITDDEFNGRNDIKFMVEYGAMKDVTVK